MSGPGTETPATPPQAPPGHARRAAPRDTPAVGSTLAGHRSRQQRRQHRARSDSSPASSWCSRPRQSIVLIVYLLFQFLLDYRIVSDFTVVLAVLTILAIWIHRWGHYDFGKGYRVVIGALGLSLALFAVINLLAWVRVGGESADFLHLIGRIIFWVSGLAAGYGAWMVFRLRED